MAIAWTELTDGVSTSDPAESASITPTADAHVYAAIAVAVETGGGLPQDTMNVSGCNLTWTQVTTVGYGGRRRIWVFRGTGASPTTGVVTMDYAPSGGAAHQETLWSIDEATGVNAADPDDGAQTASTLGATSLATGDVGTPDTGDHIYAVFASEGATISASPDDGTQLTNRGGGANVRTLMVWYDDNASDETPSCSWTGTNAAGILGFIVNVADGGGGAAPVVVRRRMLLGVGH